MIFTSISKLSFLILIYLNCKIVLANNAYEYFRILFDDQTVLKPRDIDLITNQLMENVNCAGIRGADCFTCLESNNLIDNNIIGQTVSPAEFGNLSLIIFCYLLDLNQTCYTNSTPNYEMCYNQITKNSDSINSDDLMFILESKLAPIYQASSIFTLKEIAKTEDNCINPKKLIQKYSQNRQNLVIGMESVNNLISELIYMMFFRMKIGCDLPYSNWFIDEIYSKYNSTNNTLKKNDFKNLMSDLNLESESLMPEKIFDTTKPVLNETTYKKCYTPEELFEIYGLNSSSISQNEFHIMCPSLIYLLTESVCKNRSKENQFDFVRPSDIEKYGIGTICIVIVSLLALLGIIMLPCFKSMIYEEILNTLTALAVSTLLSDALLHILPDIFSIDEHVNESSESVLIPHFVAQISTVIFVVYAFWLLELLAKHFSGIKSQSHGHSHSVYPLQSFDSHKEENGKSEAPNTSRLMISEPLSRLDLFEEKKSKFSLSNLKHVNTLGWIILIGDGIHNFADGMAIGASFSQSTKLGISTTIAVVCHEIPHELGNYGVLIKSGFNHYQALLFNLISASTCLIGFYIGVSVSNDFQVGEWILTITAGMFLYIALVDLLPTLMNEEKWSWIRFIVCNLALYVGFIIMFILVLFENHIKI